jgi:excisionase family DNA binding protein
MSTIQFIQVSPEQLLQEIDNNLMKRLDALLVRLESKQPDDYLTRKEVAAIFKVNISTINNWVRSGKLKQYGIGNRVYFLRSEVEQSPRLLNSCN